VVEDADPFELTEEEESETEVTMHWETTTSEDEEQTPVEKQLTFLVFESALMMFATCVYCGSAFVPSNGTRLDLFSASSKNAVRATINMSGKASHTYRTFQLGIF